LRILGNFFCCSGWVGLFQPPPSLENSHFFPSGQKKFHQVGSKIPRSKPVCSLIYCGLEVLISVFVALVSEWRQNGAEMGGEVNVELKSQWIPSQSRKESILRTIYSWGREALFTKVKEGSDQEISTSWKRVEYWWEINMREWEQRQPVYVNLLLLGREAKQQQLVWNDFELLVSEKYHSTKNRVNECVLR